MSDCEEKEVVWELPGVAKELRSLPQDKALAFLHNSSLLGLNKKPDLEIVSLADVVENGAFELKINGRPAFRLIYFTKLPGKVVIVKVFKKTTNGPANKEYAVAKKRLKAYLAKM